MRNAVCDAPGLIAPPDPASVERFGAALDRLHPLAPAERLGVAVSGGPDSLALLLLAHAALPGRIEAATVDHGLRPESAGEAAMVGRLCLRLGIPHAIRLDQWHDSDRQGLQAAARAYRYRELARWCDERGVRLLATAHHADDQAETLLMRLARGSGVGGLAGIRAHLPRATGAVGPQPALVRPLLGFVKRELEAIVAAAGLHPVDDPSNSSDRFDRTRARHLLATTDWLDPLRLAATASHLADADAALDWSAEAELHRRVGKEARDPDGSAPDTWLLDPLGLPDAILRRVVDRLLRDVADRPGHTAADPAGPELTRFIDRLRCGESATLGHVLARPGPRWRFSIAPARRT